VNTNIALQAISKHTYIYIYNIHIHVYMCIHIYTQTNIYAYIHVYMHIHIIQIMYTYIYAYDIYTYAYNTYIICIINKHVYTKQMYACKQELKPHPKETYTCTLTHNNVHIFIYIIYRSYILNTSPIQKRLAYAYTGWLRLVGSLKD